MFCGLTRITTQVTYATRRTRPGLTPARSVLRPPLAEGVAKSYIQHEEPPWAHTRLQCFAAATGSRLQIWHERVVYSTRISSPRAHTRSAATSSRLQRGHSGYPDLGLRVNPKQVAYSTRRTPSGSHPLAVFRNRYAIRVFNTKDPLGLTPARSVSPPPPGHACRNGMRKSRIQHVRPPQGKLRSVLQPPPRPACRGGSKVAYSARKISPWAHTRSMCFKAATGSRLQSEHVVYSTRRTLSGKPRSVLQPPPAPTCRGDIRKSYFNTRNPLGQTPQCFATATGSRLQRGHTQVVYSTRPPPPGSHPIAVFRGRHRIPLAEGARASRVFDTKNPLGITDRSVSRQLRAYSTRRTRPGLTPARSFLRPPLAEGVAKSRIQHVKSPPGSHPLDVFCGRYARIQHEELVPGSHPLDVFCGRHWQRR